MWYWWKCIPLQTQERQYALWGLWGVKKGQDGLPYTAATWDQTVGPDSLVAIKVPDGGNHFLRRQNQSFDSDLSHLVQSLASKS